MHEGDQLRAADWRQGDIIEHFPGHTWVEHEGGKPVAKVKVPGVATPGLVISQTCDIVADESKEPFVQVAKITKSPPEKVADWSRGHERRFVVDEEQGLVADIRYCAAIPKHVLRQMNRLGSLSPSRQHRLQQWLAGRYARPAVPEYQYEAIFGPGKAFYDSLAERDDRVATAARRLSSVRVGILEDEGEGLAYDLYFISEDELDEETKLDLGELAIELEEAIGTRARMNAWYLETRSTVVVDIWERLRPLQTTPMTYGGETVRGPEPSEFML